MLKNWFFEKGFRNTGWKVKYTASVDSFYVIQVLLIEVNSFRDGSNEQCKFNGIFS